MGKQTFLVEPSDPQSAKDLYHVASIHTPETEFALKTAIGLHRRSFTLILDVDDHPPSISPFFDQFTFDMETDELIVYNDNPLVLVDALVEMAMYMEGFATLIGLDDEWKIQVAIGSWHHVRETLKQNLGLATRSEKHWTVTIDPDAVHFYDWNVFNQLVTLAGCLEVDVDFPEGISNRIKTVYFDLVRIFEVVSRSIDLPDRVEFNQRLHRAIEMIEGKLTPRLDLVDGMDDDR